MVRFLKTAGLTIATVVICTGIAAACAWRPVSAHDYGYGSDCVMSGCFSGANSVADHYAWACDNGAGRQ
jgi:hypothetical protein